MSSYSQWEASIGIFPARFYPILQRLRFKIERHATDHEVAFIITNPRYMELMHGASNKFASRRWVETDKFPDIFIYSTAAFNNIPIKEQSPKRDRLEAFSGYYVIQLDKSLTRGEVEKIWEAIFRQAEKDWIKFFPLDIMAWER